VDIQRSLTLTLHAVTMAYDADKHSQMAKLYEQLSANMSASPIKKLDFARKANWHRIMGRMSAKPAPGRKEDGAEGQRASDGSAATLFSPSRLWALRDKTDLAAAEASIRRRAK
jgi:hypothetical protein